jgi:hypothetical protein
VRSAPGARINWNDREKRIMSGYTTHTGQWNNAEADARDGAIPPTGEDRAAPDGSP